MLKILIGSGHYSQNSQRIPRLINRERTALHCLSQTFKFNLNNVITTKRSLSVTLFEKLIVECSKRSTVELVLSSSGHHGGKAK